jgi:hypothetical protein
VLEELGKPLLLGIRSWPLLAAAGCLDGGVSGCGQTAFRTDGDGAVPTRPQLASRLRQAILDEIGGRKDASREAYAAARKLAAWPAAPASIEPAGMAVATARGLYDELTREIAQLEQRVGPSARPPLLHFIAVVIETYTSPLVASLPGASRDIEVWRGLLEGRSGTSDADARQEVRLHTPTKVPANRQELVEFIDQTLAKIAPGEPIVFLFSGRGLADGGALWIAPAGVEPLRQPDGSWVYDQFSHIVGLAEIAQLFRNRPLTAIYDAQFSSPATRGVDTPLQKHLDSVRPWLVQDSRLSTHSSRWRIEPASTDWSREQVHLWLEGLVTHDPTARQGCRRTVISPTADRFSSNLGAMLASALKRGITYRELVVAAARCIGGEDEPSATGDREGAEKPSRASATLVAQGNVDRLAIWGGKGSERLARFLGVQALEDIDLRLGMAIACDANARASDAFAKLSWAMLALQFAERELALPGPPAALSCENGKSAGPLELIKEANKTLGSIQATLPTAGQDRPEPELELLLLEARAHGLELAGDTEAREARDILASGLARLPEKHVTEAGIARLARLTQRALRVQNGGKLIDELDQRTRALPEAARARFRQQIEAQRQTLQEPYRIDLGDRDRR